MSPDRRGEQASGAFDRRADSANPTLERNIRVLMRRKQLEDAAAPMHEKISSAIASFAGSMPFVYLHLCLFSVWIALNLGLVGGVRPWDASLVKLGTMASLEAIFLSTFVLINQSRMGKAAERRADLDLQISLLAEHELARVAILIAKIAQRLNIDTAVDSEIEEVTRDINPEAVLDEIESISPE